MMKTMKTLNVETIKRDFPILSREVRGKRLVYLDSAATSQKPQSVIDALTDYYSNHNANIHRGLHILAEEATIMYETARKRLADFFHVKDADQFIFTRNATESLNLIAYSWGMTHLNNDSAILLSQMEHHANLVPWQQVAEKTGAELRWMKLAPTGELDMESVKQALTDGKVKLIAITHASNVLGTINPVKEIAALGHNAGALVVIDGAQAAPHLSVNISDIDADFYAVSGHKMLAPTGIGALFGKRHLLEAMPPFMTGGTMIGCVHWDHSTWNEIPFKFEAGTPNIAGAVAFGAALDYLSALGMEQVSQHEAEITAYALEKLSGISGVVIFGPMSSDKRVGAVSFTVGDIHPHDVAQLLDEQGIAVRAGHHCAAPLHELLGVMATNRASFYIYNTIDDIDALAEGIEYVKQVF